MSNQPARLDEAGCLGDRAIRNAEENNVSRVSIGTATQGTLHSKLGTAHGFGQRMAQPPSAHDRNTRVRQWIHAQKIASPGGR